MTTRTRTGVVMVALIVVAANLRPAVSSVPAVLEDIEASLGWGPLEMGLLGAIPVVAMGAFAILVPALAHRIGRVQAVRWSLVVLIIALGARLFAHIPAVLPVTALLAGAAIAGISGLVPGVVREQLPGAMGGATSGWSAALLLGATVGGALTAPLAVLTGSWSIALASWSLLAVAGLIIWQLAPHPITARTPGQGFVRLSALPWRSLPAWALTAFLGLNSVVFYSAIAWLGPSYAARGWGQVAGGWLFGLFTFGQVLAALTMPVIADRLRARRAAYLASVLVTTAGLVVVGMAPDFLPPLVLLACGFGLGASFSMGLVLLSEYALDAAASARLTAMAFFVCYLVAALGPFVTGWVLELTGDWSALFWVLAVVCIAQAVTVIPLRRGVVIP